MTQNIFAVRIAHKQSKWGDYICGFCGGKFEQYKYRNPTYCSKSCKGRSRFGENGTNWKGGIKITIDGYKRIRKTEHPRSDNNGYVLESVLVAEKALYKPLPLGAEVHHINKIKHDNRPENLVICQNSSYHSTLHRRERAYKVCGYAHWRKCCYCKQYDDPQNMYIPPSTSGAYHRECMNKYCQKYYKKTGEGNDK